MTDADAHGDVIERLTELGGCLDVHGDGLVDEVLDRIAARPRGSEPAERSDRRTWLVAAAIVVLVVGFVGHPDGRAATARWFGLAGVQVDVDPALPTAPAADQRAVPGPGDSELVTVDGRAVLVSAIDGRLFEEGITKTVQSSDQVIEVRVGDHPGLWIGGEPHQVAYESPDGGVMLTRVASNTLLWQDGPVLYRVEGFEDLAGALEFATGT